MTQEILTERAFFQLNSLGFYTEYERFNKLIIVREAKRVFRGAYDSERVQLNMPIIKDELDELRNRWNIKDHLSAQEKEIQNIKTIKMLKKKMGISSPEQKIKLFGKEMDQDDFMARCRYLLLANVLRQAQYYVREIE